MISDCLTNICISVLPNVQLYDDSNQVGIDKFMDEIAEMLSLPTVWLLLYIIQVETQT